MCGLVVASAAFDVRADAEPDRQHREVASIVEQAQGASNAVATWRLRAGGRDLVIASLGERLSYELGESVRRIFSVEAPASP